MTKTATKRTTKTATKTKAAPKRRAKRSKKAAAEVFTATSQAVLNLPAPEDSDDCAYRIKQMDLDICEDHKMLAKLFAIWCLWFTGGPTPTPEWWNEVWQYLPRSRWSQGRIQGYLFRQADERLRDLTPEQLVRIDPEAIIWVGNPNVGLTTDTRDSAIEWMKKRAAERVPVTKEAVCREFRRKTEMKPKMYFENKSPIVSVTVRIMDESKTDDQIKAAAQYVISNGCKRSTVRRTESGNYTEVRPQLT